MKQYSLIPNIYIQVFTLILILSLFGSCEPQALPSTDECIELEINIACERPSTNELTLVTNLLESHTTNGFLIFNEYLDGCYEVDENKIETINSYLKNDITNPSTIDTINSLNVLIHELTHALSGQFLNNSESYCENKQHDKLWISNQNLIIVKNKKLFPVKEIRPLLMSAAVNSIYTEPYIEKNTTNQGVYALMNEYNAYYQGLNTAFELYSAIDEIYQSTNDETLLGNYVIQIENEISSYFMFKYYITLYINYAKENHPLDYENIKSNAAFGEAFNNTSENFIELIDAFKILINENDILDSFSNYDVDYNEIYKKIEEEIERLE